MVPLPLTLLTTATQLLHVDTCHVTTADGHGKRLHGRTFAGAGRPADVHAAPSTTVVFPLACDIHDGGLDMATPRKDMSVDDDG